MLHQGGIALVDKDKANAIDECVQRVEGFVWSALDERELLWAT